MKKLVRMAGLVLLYILVMGTAFVYRKNIGIEQPEAYMQKEEDSYVLTCGSQGARTALTVYRFTEGKKQLLWRLLPTDAFRVTDFSLGEDAVAITGIVDESGTVLVYQYPLTGENRQFTKDSFQMEANIVPKEAWHREGILYVADGGGKMYLADGRRVDKGTWEGTNSTIAEKRWKNSIRSEWLLTLAVITGIYVLCCLLLWLLFAKAFKKRRLFASLAIQILMISAAMGLLAFCIISNFVSGDGKVYQDMEKVTRQVLIGCGIAWAVFNFLFLGALYLRLRPLTKISGMLERMTRGDWENSESAVPDNELGNILSALYRLGKSYSLKQYTNAHAMHYYKSFSPEGFEGLLGKESIQELRVGDMATVEGTMELISIPVRRNQAGVQQLNLLMRALEQQKEEDGENGVLLNGDRDFGKLRVVYKNRDSFTGAQRAFLSGLELMSDGVLQEAEIYPFVLLHSASLVCGLAGNSESVYPFADCPELEALSRYSFQLKEMGIRMVITEEAKGKLQTACELRYIGYIKTQEEQRFRLYEVLDACSLEEKQKKQMTAERFGKALDLFYQDDFYLARMHFTDVLKECPGDGVARWYLFTCERLFNMENNEEICHHLFS